MFWKGMMTFKMVMACNVLNNTTPNIKMRWNKCMAQFLVLRPHKTTVTHTLQACNPARTVHLNGFCIMSLTVKLIHKWPSDIL
jgi:hypothetical protein